MTHLFGQQEQSLCVKCHCCVPLWGPSMTCHSKTHNVIHSYYKLYRDTLHSQCQDIQVFNWWGYRLSYMLLVCYLKLPFLFAAWLSELFIINHTMWSIGYSWSPFLPITCLYGKKELLWVPVCPSGVFSQEKTPLAVII